ncbi:MAG: hypothetical protein IKY33_03950 [Clostridia bacterium]|nr:hypothetical protein [Clostridia bacterium]
MTYILTDAALQIDFSISNRGQQALPYSLGGHWGFALEDNIENYALQFDKPVALNREVLDGAYISGPRSWPTVTHIVVPII